MRGQTWARQDAGTTYDLTRVDFPDASHGWALMDPPSSPNLLALRTTDGGATWTKVKVAYNVYATAVRFIDQQQGWIGGLVGPSYGMLHTTDGGATWTKQKLPTMDYLFDLFFLNEKEGWAAGGISDDDGVSHAFLVHTSDGGATWTKLPEVYDALFRSCYFLDASRGWAAGDGGLYSTTDGGRSWHQDAACGEWDLTDVTGTDAEHVWAFGDRQILSDFDVAGDTAAPSTLNDADLRWRRTPVTVTLTANDTGGSGLLRTEYRVDGDPSGTRATSVPPSRRRPTTPATAARAALPLPRQRRQRGADAGDQLVSASTRAARSPWPTGLRRCGAARGPRFATTSATDAPGPSRPSHQGAERQEAGS